MRIVSHRGNLNGPDKTRENEMFYLVEALNKGFDIEFDLWYFDDRFWLGHDRPDRSFSMDTLMIWTTKYPNQNMYVHCKNIWALEKMVYFEKSNLIPFFHDVDQCILLRNNTIWVHPNAINSCYSKEKSIAVFSTCKSVQYDINLDLDFKGFYGICTDYPIDVRNSL